MEAGLGTSHFPEACWPLHRHIRRRTVCFTRHTDNLLPPAPANVGVACQNENENAHFKDRVDQREGAWWIGVVAVTLKGLLTTFTSLVRPGAEYPLCLKAVMAF